MDALADMEIVALDQSQGTDSVGATALLEVALERGASVIITGNLGAAEQLRSRQKEGQKLPLSVLALCSANVRDPATIERYIPAIMQVLRDIQEDLALAAQVH
jgi:hypothetical protein